MSLRLFLAIPLSSEIAEQLSPLQKALPGASWRPQETFHLTLRFFGEIDEALARDLDGELGLIEEAPFEMRLKAAGSFGGREPSAVWIGVEAPPALARLASASEKAARRAGLAPERRSFIPHITLAYLHGTTDIEAARFQERLGGFSTEPFWIDHFVMFSSHPTKQGSRYREEAVYPLVGLPKA